MNVLSKLFLDFCVLGGMLAVVAHSLETDSFEGSPAMQRQLIADYREGVQKYAHGTEMTRILNVLESVSSQLARDNKEFQVSKAARGASLQRYRGSIEWLQVADIVALCHRLHFPKLPLRGNVDPDSFKVYLADTGILVAMLDNKAATDLRGNRNLGVCKAPSTRTWRPTHCRNRGWASTTTSARTRPLRRTSSLGRATTSSP